MKWTLILISVSAVLLCGCASIRTTQSPECHAPPSDPSGRTNITVFYATNRAPHDSPNGAISFGSERSDDMRFGTAVLSIPPVGDRRYGSVSGIRVVSVTEIGTPLGFKVALEKEVRIRRPKTRDALLYIHGFSNSFERSLARAAQFAFDGCLEAIPVVFSWPSWGSPFERPYDQDSATFSRDAAASLLHLILSTRGLEETHVLAHSMGSWIALEAMRSRTGWLSREGKKLSGLGVAILASPDVDLDIFRKEIRDARLSAKMIVLLTSRRDVPLGIARFLAHGTPRAGDATADELARAGVGPAGNFRIIDLDAEDIGYCPGAGHRCATGNPTVVRQLGTMMGQIDD
jgi:esterase/lipase superfamily enzyme